MKGFEAYETIRIGLINVTRCKPCGRLIHFNGFRPRICTTCGKHTDIVRELRDLLEGALEGRDQGAQFEAGGHGFDDEPADRLHITIPFSEQHPLEEFRGCFEVVADDVPAPLADLIVTVLNALPELLDLAEHPPVLTNTHEQGSTRSPEQAPEPGSSPRTG